MSADRGNETAGCERCWPTNPETAWEGRQRWTLLRELVDDLHLGVNVDACGSCGQQFASVFSEQVDWTDGDDPQYWTVLPLSAEEVTSLDGLKAKALLERLGALAADRRALHRDYPKGGEPRSFWRTGLVVL